MLGKVSYVAQLMMQSCQEYGQVPIRTRWIDAESGMLRRARIEFVVNRGGRTGSLFMMTCREGANENLHPAYCTAV